VKWNYEPWRYFSQTLEVDLPNLGGIFADFIQNAKIIAKKPIFSKTCKRLIYSILRGYFGYDCIILIRTSKVLNLGGRSPEPWRYGSFTLEVFKTLEV